MAAKVGLRLEVDVGSSLEVSREYAGTKTVQSGWGVGCRARGSGSMVPLLQKNMAGQKAPQQWEQVGGVVQSPHEMGVRDQSLGCIK